MDDKQAAFNEQMNDWVSRQGLWFQLRHAADGQSLFSRLARLLLRLVIILLVCAVIFGVYLVRRVGQKGFKEDLRQGVETTLKGTECHLKKISKDRDTITISLVEMDGAEDAFFHRLHAGLIRFNMGLTDGLLGAWDGEGVSIDRLDIDLKAGASDDEVAAKTYQALFVEHPSFKFKWIEIQKASLKWGYSANNRGSIQNSHLTMVREGDGWRMEFKGGTFTQNWLRHLEIAKIVVIADQQGVHVKEAQLLAGGGTLSFQFKVGEGGQPDVVGTMEMDSFPVKSILPYRFTEWIQGKISGKGTISGSTNSQGGIALDLNVSLNDGDVLVMRDSLPLLSALTAVDMYNSYRKISFTSGGCHIRTGGGVMYVDEIDFKAGELFHLGGKLDIRPPTHKEIAEALDIEDVRVVTDVIEKNWKLEDDLLELSDAEWTLQSGATEENLPSVKGNPANPNAGSALQMKDGLILTEKNLLRFEGLVRVGLKGDAFDKAPRLKEEYPPDDATGRIWIDVPLNGRLQSLTWDQAKTLYALGRKRK